MTNLETLIVFVLGFLPAVIFWILLISYVTNKIFDAIERDKQYEDELTGYDKIVEQIKVEKENRLHPLFKNSAFRGFDDYEREKTKYVEDKLNDYLNTNEAVLSFGRVFSKSSSYEAKKDEWKHHLENKRKEFGNDFDNL